MGFGSRWQQAQVDRVVKRSRWEIKACYPGDYAAVTIPTVDRGHFYVFYFVYIDVHLSLKKECGCYVFCLSLAWLAWRCCKALELSLHSTMHYSTLYQSN